MNKMTTYKWLNGALNVLEHYFETLEEAVHHAKHSKGHLVKVHNVNGELVHQFNNNSTAPDINTYA